MHAPQPSLTEVEALKHENLRLEGLLLEHAGHDWRMKLSALKADVESTREGWDFNPRTAQWTKKDETATE